MSSSKLKISPHQLIQDLLKTPAVLEAFRYFETEARSITDEHIRICTIPASPFGEQQRANYLCEKFLEIGLSEVNIDEVGNCLGLLRGESSSPLMVVSAHLDTVFSESTDFTVREEGQRLLAPGISDDGSGLAALLAIARAISCIRIKTVGSILFVGTVGEEGEGNLRGVRYLCTNGPWANRIDAFLSFDGSGLDRITNRALGSHRYRVKVSGPGGHSWGDFGIPNPMHALGRAISKLTAYPISREIRTTYNVGIVRGGTSVNSIPCEASMDVDLRAAEETELKRLDAYFRRAVHEAVDQENSSRRPGDPMLTLNMDLVGQRPGGQTSPSSPLVRLAQQATRVLGCEPQLDQSSTDSNLPISLGIPSVTLGAGGSSGSSHTLDEWFEPLHRDLGLKRGLLTILGTVKLSQT